MTSMLLTERRTFGRPFGPPSRGSGGPPGPPPPLLLLGAVTRRDSLLLGVGRRRLLDHRPHDRLVRLDPVADQLPFGPVPLLKLDRAAPLMVHAGDLDRLEEVVGAELLQALLVEVQVLQAPPDLLAGQRLLAEFRLRGADRPRVPERVDYAAVVVDSPEALGVFQVPLVAAGVDVFLDVLDDRKVRPARVEGGRDKSFGGVPGRDGVLLRAAPPTADDVVARK